MIERPRKSKKREVLRAVIEGVAGLTPISSFLARLYQTTHPSGAEQDRERWQGEVTEQVNGLDAQQGLIEGKVADLARRPTVIAEVETDANGNPRSGFGITSITDFGTGVRGIHLAEDASDPHRVIIEPNGALTDVVAKRSSGFCVLTTSGNGAAIDKALSIEVRGIKPS